MNLTMLLTYSNLLKIYNQHFLTHITIGICLVFTSFKWMFYLFEYEGFVVVIQLLFS